MFPYWLLFSIFAAGSLEYRRRGLIGAHAHPILAIALVFVALMIGLRFEVGGDWGTYLRMFEDLRYADLGVSMASGDPGYGVANWLSHKLGQDIWLVNLICGAIFSWGLFKFAQRQPNPWLAVLVAVPYLIIVVAMGYTRQGAAIGLILAGLAAFDRGRSWRFAFYILAAVAFHKSAIIILPLVALAGVQRKVATLAILGVLTLMLYYFLVAASIDKLVSGYVDAEYQSEGAFIRVAMNLPPALLFLFFRARFNLSPEQGQLWRNFAWAAIFSLVLLMVIASSTAIDRLALNLIPLQMFVLSRLPEVFPDKGRANAQLTLAIIAYSATIQLVWFTSAVNAGEWLPYTMYSPGMVPKD